MERLPERSPRRVEPFPDLWLDLGQYAMLLANQDRTCILGPGSRLAWHAGAAVAARLHSIDQLDRGYMGHRSPDGDDVADRLARLGIPYHTAGENIGRIRGTGVPIRTSIESIQRAFMGSPGHRANILDSRFRSIGVGIAARNGEVFLTQVFLDSDANVVAMAKARVTGGSI